MFLVVYLNLDIAIRACILQPLKIPILRGSFADFPQVLKIALKVMIHSRKFFSTHIGYCFSYFGVLKFIFELASFSLDILMYLLIGTTQLLWDCQF